MLECLPMLPSESQCLFGAPLLEKHCILKHKKHMLKKGACHAAMHMYLRSFYLKVSLKVCWILCYTRDCSHSIFWKYPLAFFLLSTSSMMNIPVLQNFFSLNRILCFYRFAWQTWMILNSLLRHTWFLIPDRISMYTQNRMLSGKARSSLSSWRSSGCCIGTHTCRK